MSQYLYVDLESLPVPSSINASLSRCGQKEILSSGRLQTFGSEVIISLMPISAFQSVQRKSFRERLFFLFVFFRVNDLSKITASIRRYLDRTMHCPGGRICLEINRLHLESHLTCAKYVWNNEFFQLSLVFTKQFWYSVRISVMVGISRTAF